MKKLLVGCLVVIFSLSQPSAAIAGEAIADWPIRGAWLRLPAIPDPNWLPGHRGLDLAGPVGMAVRSPVNGPVVWVGEIDHVPGITITDQLGNRHSLQPVAASVEIGDWVLRGEIIGAIADGDHCRVSCLHWGVRAGRRYIDPRWLLPPAIRRLPAYARG